MWNLATNQSQVVAKHDAPVRHVHHLKDMNNMLVTGSWDKTIRYWDLRQPNPVHTQQLPERVYSMDVRHPLLVVGLANRRIQVGACCEQVPAPCLALWLKVAHCTSAGCVRHPRLIATSYQHALTTRCCIDLVYQCAR